jgi:hypothetical protein
MKLFTLIPAIVLLSSTPVFSAIYTGQDASEKLMQVKANKKSLTGFKCNVTKRYISKIETKKDFLTGKVTTTPQYINQTVNDIECYYPEELAIERIRTSSQEIGTIELETEVDTHLIFMGKAGRNKNTGSKNQYKAVMICNGRNTTMMATFDRLSETIESAYYSSKQGTRGDTVKLFDERANKLPMKQWASVNILTNCRVTTK